MVRAIQAEFEGNEFRTRDCKSHSPAFFLSVQQAKIKAASQQRCAERTSQVIPPFGPIEAATSNAVTRRFESGGLDAKFIREPFYTRRRDQKALTFTGGEQHSVLQC